LAIWPTREPATVCGFVRFSSLAPSLLPRRRANSPSPRRPGPASADAEARSGAPCRRV